MSLRVRWKNWKLRRERSKLEKEYDRVATEAKQKKNEDILNEWYGINGWEFDTIDAQVKENVSRDVLNQAEELYLPTPSSSDQEKWVPKEDLGTTGQRWSILTLEAMTELNARIRQEKLARLGIWESRAKIVGTIVASLTGVIGTIIGLVAILRK